MSIRKDFYAAKAIKAQNVAPFQPGIQCVEELNAFIIWQQKQKIILVK